MCRSLLSSRGTLEPRCGRLPGLLFCFRKFFPGWNLQSGQEAGWPSACLFLASWDRLGPLEASPPRVLMRLREA